MPQHFACQVVAADLSAARNHQFGALGGFPEVRGAEVAGFIARDLPQDLACLGVERAQGRSLFVVVHHIHPSLVQDRGSGGAPSVAHLVGLNGLRPNHLALEIEAEQAHRSKQHVHVLAVGDRGLGGVAVLEVDGRGRNRSVKLGAPEGLAGVAVEAQGHPALALLRGFRAVAAEIQTLLRSLQFSLAHCRGEEHPFSPHDRRRPPASGNFCAPGDIGV